MVATDGVLFVAGPGIQADEMEVYSRYSAPEVQEKMAEQMAAFEGRRGAVLMAVAKNDGKMLAAYRLKSAPVFDGVAATEGCLFLSTTDGRVMCLSADGGEPLEKAPDLKPGPAPTGEVEFIGTAAHPDFQQLSSIQVASSELGYRMQSGSREGGFALRQLEAPVTGQVELRLKIRPRPGASPDTPGNGFLVFGDAPTDERLVKCGFRISGQRLYIVQGALTKGQSKSVPVRVRANEVVEIRVAVDLGSQKLTAVMNGQVVDASLKPRLDAIRWIGCCVASVDADFSPIEIVVK
jgi:hypothetical protein